MSKHSPATDLPHTPSKWFWSSSSGALKANYAWVVSFNYGYVDDEGKSIYYFVRCVR